MEQCAAQLNLFGAPERASGASEVQCALVVETAEFYQQDGPKALGAYKHRLPGGGFPGVMGGAERI